MPVQHLHKVVNHIKCQELVVGGVDGAQKVEAGVALVDELEVAPVEEVAVLRGGGSCSGGQQQRCNMLACAYKMFTRYEAALETCSSIHV